MTSKFHSKPFLGLSLIMLSVPLCFFLFSNIKFDNSLLSLLPATEQDPLVEEGVKHFTEKISSRSLYLIGNKDFTKATNSADNFVKGLKKHSVFSEIIYKAEEDSGKNWYETIFPHRYHFLTKSNRQLLEEGSVAFYKDRIKKLHSPLSSLYSANLEKDPLMLFGDFIQSIPSPGNVNIKNGYLTIEKDKTHYIMISTSFKAEVFDR